jgi:hypothetical protein
MERKVHIGNKWWKIMTIYSKKIKTTRKRVEDAMKENREDCIFLGSDFSGRIAERGTRNWEEERGDGKRNSKDKVENTERKRLMEWIEGDGWEVLNGNKQGDEEGEWTYTYMKQVKNSDRVRNNEQRRMGKSRRIQNRRKSRVGLSPAGNKYRRNEPSRKGKKKNKKRAESQTSKRNKRNENKRQQYKLLDSVLIKNDNSA